MSKPSYLPIPRRAFLSAMGVGAAVLPMLSVEQVMAQTAAKRMFILCWSNGMMNREEVWPAAGPTGTLPDFMQVHEPHKADMIFINGLNYRFIRDSPISENTGHASYPGMLTGKIYARAGSGTSSDVAGGISIDQHVGGKLREAGYQGLTSLNLGVKVDSTARLSWRAGGANNAIVPEENPYRVFDDLFGGEVAAPDNNAGPSVAERMREMRTSILDYVAKDLGRFSASLGVEDKKRIDAHLTSVRDLEEQLGVSVGDNGPFTPPTLEQGLDVDSTVNFHTTTYMQMQISAAAFAADVTRVVVMQMGDQGGSNIVITPLGFDAGNNTKVGNTGLIEGLHVIAHDNGADKRRMDGWFQEQIANMITLLKETSDPVGPVFDNTVLLAMNNMRTGNHETTKVPAVLASGMDYFATGRTLDMDAPNNGVLIALANALEVPTETFGEANYGGEMTDLRA